MKIYVITKGVYSDYHICAVTEDEQKAQLLAKKFSDKRENAEIEEFDTEDNERLLSYKNLYHCYYDDGLFPEKPIVVKETSFDDVLYANMFHVKESDYVYYSLEVLVNADNEEQALKIAADKFAQYKAEHMGL